MPSFSKPDHTHYDSKKRVLDCSGDSLWLRTYP